MVHKDLRGCSDIDDATGDISADSVWVRMDGAYTDQ